MNAKINPENKVIRRISEHLEFRIVISHGGTANPEIHREKFLKNENEIDTIIIDPEFAGCLQAASLPGGLAYRNAGNF